jgi:uncharacterized protein
MSRKLLLWLALALSVFGVAFALLLKPVGREFFYHRARPVAESQLQREARPGWTVDRIEVEPDVTLVGYVRPPAVPNAPVVLLFHGNAGAGITGVPGFFEALAQGRPWGMAAYSYRGFGASTGSPGEDVIMSDALAIVEHLQRAFGIKTEQLVLAGNSMGAGVALSVAARLSARGTPPCATVSASGYTSLERVVDSRTRLPIGWFVPDKYDVLAFIDEVPAPVMLLHGTEDRVVPIAHSEELAERMGDRATLVPAVGLGHTPWADAEAVAATRRFIETHCAR